MNPKNTGKTVEEIQILAKELGFRNPSIVVCVENSVLKTKLEIDVENNLTLLASDLRITYLSFSGALEISLQDIKSSLEECKRIAAIGG